MRIQFTERFCPIPYDERDDWKNLHPNEKLPVDYRLIYPRLDDIDMPLEIPGKKNYCELLFYTGDVIVVKGSFGDICDKLDEREAVESGDSLGMSE